MKKIVIFIEFLNYLGGFISGGLGVIDIGNKVVIGGIL